MDLNSIATAGQTFVMNCITEGFPLPSISFYKDGIIISDSDDRFKITRSVENINVVESLSVRDVKLSDKGRYYCNASNFLVIEKNIQSNTHDVDVHCKCVQLIVNTKLLLCL